MTGKRVLYQEPQATFFHDVMTNLFTDKMTKAATYYNLHPSNSELMSWGNNAPKIKDLLQLSGVTDTYVTFEYLVPYNMKRIDCILYGRNSQNQGNVVHIELKQWDNKGVRDTDCEGNFNVDDEDSDTTFQVQAYTGGGHRLVSHPSQQVRGYNDYLTGFIEVLSSKELHIEGLAYCYNYRKNKTPNTLFDEKYSELLQAYKTYAGDEVQELAQHLQQALGNGDGETIFHKMISGPIRPSKKLLESAANLIHEGNVSAFALIEEQIIARNVILDKIRKIGNKKSIIIVKGGPGTGKTVIALHILALLAGNKKSYNIRYATKSKPLLEGVKDRLPRGSKAKLLFSNVTQFIPANCEPNNIDVLLVDEAHRISNSANNQYTPTDKRTNLTQIQTIVQAAKISVFFIDDKQAIRSVEIGSSQLIRECAKEYNADIVEVELKSQFRCNGSDNYLDWLEQVIYNEPVKSSFKEDEFDFKIFDDPQTLYDEIKRKDSIDGQSARLTAGFCWPWSSSLDENGDFVKDVAIGNFAMPWETKDTIANIPKGYVKWYEWAYKPEGIKQVGCIYTAQGFEFDYIGVIIGPDLRYDTEQQCLITDIKEIKDPMLKRNAAYFDNYARNIYRVLMSRGMKGCYVYCCDENLKEYLRAKIRDRK